MPLVDANIILRYLMNDHPVMSPQAREIILSGVETTPEVLAGYHHMEGTEISTFDEKLGKVLLRNPVIPPEES